MKTSDTVLSRGRLPALLAAVLLPFGLCLTLFLTSTPAHAQDDDAKKRATEYFRKGRTKFKLGDFDEAIRLFKQAYETSPHHAFLFNLGQAYRQKGDCKEAIFFYKGYLTEAGPKAKNRKLVESHIAELTEICKATDSSKEKPPNDVAGPDSESDGAGDGGGDGERGGDGDGDKRVAAVGDGPPGVSDSAVIKGGDVSLTAEPWKPSLLTSTLILGPSLMNFGGNLDSGGARPALGLSVGYPLSFGKVGVSIGGMFTLAGIAESLNGDRGGATLSSAIINVGVRYWLIDKLALGIDLGGGGLFLGGLADGNMFVSPGDMVTGTLAMPNLRAAIAVDYLINKNLMVSAAPFVYSTSPPKDGLSTAIEGFTRMEFMVGIGYRM